MTRRAMVTTLLNPTLWLLAALAVSAVMAQAAGDDARTALARVVRLGASRGGLLILALAAAGGVGSRVVLGYLAPGAYAEEVIAARSYLAERQLYHGNDRADFSRWLSEEPVAESPWTLPGLTVCQANAIERRPQFYTSQGHSPVLLLASVPVVRVAGGRALYVAMALLSLVALSAMVAALASEFGLRFPSPPALLLALALAGWQPVLAALRQGDAVLIVGALIVWAWHLSRSNATTAGLLCGLGGALAPPASVVLLAVPRISWRAVAVGAGTLLLALVAAGALGGVMLFVDYAASTLTSARLYATSPNTYSAIAKLLIRTTSPALWAAAAAMAATAVAVWRSNGRQRLDVPFASCAALAFLLSPIAWSQHATLLVVPLAVLLSRVLSSGRPARLLAWAVIAILLSLPDPPNLWIDAALRYVTGEGAATLLPTAPTAAGAALWVSMLAM